MNWFKNMKIRAKMLLSFMLVIALVLAMLVIAVTGMRGVGVNYDTVIHHPIALRATMLEFHSEYRNIRRVGATMAMHAGTDDQGYEPLYKEAEASHELALSLFERARGIISTNPELTQDEKNIRLGNNEALHTLYIRYHDEVTVPIIEATRRHDRAAVMAILDPAAELAETVRVKLREQLDLAISTAAMQTARAEANTRSAVTLMIILSAVSAVSAVVISLFVSNRVSRPLEPLTKFMRNVASHGDIGFSPEDAATIRKYGRSGDEMGQLIVAGADFVRRIMEVGKALETVSDGDLTQPVSLLSDRDTMGLAFGKMLRNLNSMCGDINVSSIQVATGASQVTAGAEALSAGATEQAASIEQLSVSIAEMAERTKTTAGMAGQAADLANHIRSSAEKSNLQMNEMMKAVTGISEASQSIRKIIKTIDEIAFQTNILAVNAAVEAAHAGKYGKGFSVVASEVRSLAAKSAEAAKDTERLIANSMEKADLGVLIAGETATSLSEIVAGIKDNSQLVAEIARSAEEQSNSIAEINAGVTQVSRVVQQNSVTAEESAAASEEMAGQSVMLQRLASQFKLSEEPAYRLPVPASASEPEPARQLAGPRYAQINNSDQ